MMSSMAYRGPYIFDGYLPRRGRVRVFQDLDSSDHFFCMGMKSDKQYYVRRSAVTGIPGSKRSPHLAQEATKPDLIDDQLKLF